MSNLYIKNFPRGDLHDQASLANLLPIFTDHLNVLNQSLFLIRSLKKIASEANSDTTKTLSDIESQGRLMHS